MKKIALNEVMVGMKTARDVNNPRGMVLVKKGATLTEGVIRQLERYDITTVLIEDIEDEKGTEIDPKGLEKRKSEQMEQLKPIFAKVATLPWMKQLMDAVATVRAGRL
ncbi:MAG: hypothetical protein U9P49_00180 [Thermodesulfobacteriota bacterium]|nr:hypothetical protein [Thermodesulfobacteriota bacterium]